MDLINELKVWLAEQQTAIANQHAQKGDERLVLQGRHEACGLVLEKIVQLANDELSDETQKLEREALAETETDVEEAAAESTP